MRRVRRWGWLAAVGASVAAPAWAEHAAARRIDDAVGLASAELGEHSIDIDFGGLSIRGASLEASRVHGHAQLVRVEPRLDGLHVRVEGLEARLSRPTTTAGPASAPSSPAPAASARPGLPGPLRGIPLHVSVEGSVSVDGPKDTRLIAVDPQLEVEAGGEVRVRANGKLVRGDRVLATAEDVSLRATQLGAAAWEVTTRVRLESGAWLPVVGTIGRESASLKVRAGEGSARAELAWGGTPRVHLEAERLGLGFLPALDGLGEHLGVDLSEASLDGEIELERADRGVVGHFQGVRIDGVVIESDALSKDPLYMREIGIDGRLHVGPDELEGALSITHADLVSLVSGRVDRDRVDVDLALEPIPCQALLDSMPAGFLPVLEGMQLGGEVQAAVSLAFEFAALARAREHASGDEDPEASPGAAEPPAPGELVVDFPFLERCAVTRDAPGIDLDALAGNYRHRFLSGGGREKSRILAVGAEDFVPIVGAPELARAFVILEDARFWYHDGFDREQMARAFWHNLGVKGFSRGASTITQQTARNLWLGHDRSLGRKLQEAVLTARLERELDKRRILEIYMNIIELGPEVHGVDEAARYHFGRAPHELNTIEALHVASLAPAPVTYSRRFASGEVDARWREHLEQQVERLRVHRLLSSAAAQQAVKLPLRLVSHAI